MPDRSPLPLLLTYLSVLLLLVPLACAPVEAQSIDALIDAWAEEVEFTGVVLVGTEDSTLTLRAFGFADQARSAPTTVDTPFQLGSIGKWVSSLTVLRLIDQGLLDLHAPISTYLPSYRHKSRAPVTLHHLLSHTSGVPNDLIAALREDQAVLESEMSTHDAVQRFASGDLLFEPGERFDYSHSNWILVQAIVERATGEPFAAVVDRELVVPLGLANTGIAVGDFDRYGVAQSYRLGESTNASRNPERAPTFLGAAGGSYSSAPALLILAEAVMSSAFLSDASRRSLNAVYVEDEGYAYGGRVRKMDVGGTSETVLWHTGSNGSSKSRLTRTQITGFTIVTLSNTGAEHDGTGELHEQIIARLASRE